MTLAPLLSSPLITQAHTVAAFAAVALLIPIALMRKGTARHHRIGWIWVTCMAFVCVSSFSIYTSSGYSWIHILSVISMVSVTMGVVQRRRGDIRSHKLFMIGAASGLIGAGLFTIMPGRIMHAVLVG